MKKAVRFFYHSRNGDILSPIQKQGPFPNSGGRMPKTERDRELRRRRARRAKVSELRKRLNETRDAKLRAQLIADIVRLSPEAPVPPR
jgi:hypothetical protein